jgi:hypothetical protein
MPRNKIKQDAHFTNFCLTGTAMNARTSENYLAISSKSVEIFWAEIYWGRHFLRAESSLIQSSCRSYKILHLLRCLPVFLSYPDSRVRQATPRFSRKIVFHC